jgi:hypothetical protein
MIHLHPEILMKDGKEQFAILPWEEFVQIQALLEDARDLLELRKAKAEDDNSPSASLADVLERFGVK